MNNCECNNCEYLLSLKSANATRFDFHCNHPNQMYIYDYFKEHDIKKMPGFIGYGKCYGHEPTNKTTPKWCPNKRGGENE